MLPRYQCHPFMYVVTSINFVTAINVDSLFYSCSHFRSLLVLLLDFCPFSTIPYFNPVEMIEKFSQILLLKSMKCFALKTPSLYTKAISLGDRNFRFRENARCFISVAKKNVYFACYCWLSCFKVRTIEKLLRY
jgi:hypothetical protein